MRSKRLKFLICTPRQIGGGSIVLHALCQKLQSMGYEAKVLIPCWSLVTKKRAKKLSLIEYLLGFLLDEGKVLVKRLLGGKILKLLHRNLDGVQYYPVKGCKRKLLPFVDDDTVVIYPEVVYGNPLGAKHVVRWLLFNYQYADDSEAFDSRDVFVAYREQFDSPELNPNHNLVQIHFFDSDMYKQTNFGEREGCCYVVRKGKNRKDLPQTFDGPVIDSLPDEEKVIAFNRYKVCYFYDTQTFYANIAAVCGCIPVVVMEKGCTVDSYLKGSDSPAGIAYGEEDIPRALATRSELLESLNFEKANEEATKEFLRIVDKNFEIK